MADRYFNAGTRCPTSTTSLPRRPLLCQRQVQVVQPFGAVRVEAAVFLPVDRELRPQYPRGDKRADVQPYAVVQVRLPAERLALHRLPAHLDVVRRLGL